MTTTFITTADFAISGQASPGIMARITTAVAAAMTRARKRREYRRMLDNDELMQDVGVSRAEVRRALADLGRF
jgi:uncharacterized protein YjiS (DUF1127 family)